MVDLIVNTPSLLKESLLKQAQRIIVKVGSSLVTDNGRGLDYIALENWAKQIVDLRQQNKQVILVSSGAIAQGMQRLRWVKRPTHISELQAAAAVGQVGLVQAYEHIFAKYGIATAQILLTHADLIDRERYLNARSVLLKLLELGVVPIINENDTVVTDEIKVGDNDTLGALVSNLIDADVLVILTDQAGLYSSDPRKNSDAVFIGHAIAGDIALEHMAGGAGSSLGKGGMITKILAAKRAAFSGAHTIIANGKEPNVLPRLALGEKIGTHLQAIGDTLSARKQWLADHLQLRGSLLLDIGACHALTVDNKSLLPIGIIKVVGDFSRGEVVACINESGLTIARGIVNYSAAEVRLILRKTSRDIHSILGYTAGSEVIHRDNMSID